MPLCASVYLCLVVTCWERADPLGSRLWCLTVSLSLSHWYPGSGVVYLVVSIPDLCTLTYIVLVLADICLKQFCSCLMIVLC